MIYRGSFSTVDHRLITVELWTDVENSDYNTEKVVEIGRDGLFFGGDPVTIIRDVNDSFDTVIIHQAEITLKTSKYLGDSLTAMSDSHILVRIWEGETLDTSGYSNVIFYGHAEPLVFNQPYVTTLDEFTITATDRLGDLKYFKYEFIKDKDGYNEKLLTAGYKSFYHLLNKCSQAMNSMGRIWYDMSIGVTSGTESAKTIFEDIAVNDTVIFGDGVENTMTYYEVLDNLLKYLNLHIICIGMDFYIFNWDSIRRRRTKWYNIFNFKEIDKEFTLERFRTALHAGSDTNLSMDDIYTQVTAKADIREIETAVSSPLDSEDLTTMYQRQPYMTEYWSDGEGDRAFDAFYNMMLEKDTDYDAAKKSDWYCQHYFNKYWKTFILDRNDGIRKEISTLAEYSPDYGEYINQGKIWRSLYENPCSAGIFKFGHIDTDMGVVKDNAPVHRLEMTPYLCFSLRGNHVQTEEGHLPADQQLLNASPVCEFKSPFNGGAYSPNGEGVTNYLVFSGKILLQKEQKETDPYITIRNYFSNYGKGTGKAYYKYYTVPSRDNGDGRYYTRKWWDRTASIFQDRVTSECSFHPPRAYTVEKTGGFDQSQKERNFHTYLRSGGDLDYEYKYTKQGDNNDLYYKMPLLECELIIGNKRLVETNWGRRQGEPNTVLPKYEWVPVGAEPWIEIKTPTGTYHEQIKTFSLGIDPKIGDYIVGKEHDISDNVSYEMGIEASGTAIPIKASDNLAGDVTFRILGPITTMWNDVDKYSHSVWLFWSKSHWSEKIRYVLSECETMFVKDFKCKLYSSMDAADNADKTGKEIVYMSAEDSRIEPKDDITFTFCTQPTIEVFLENGVEYRNCENAVIMALTKSPVSKLYSSTSVTADIPEKLYVDAYYNEYHNGKLLLDGTFHIDEMKDWNKIYRLQSIGDKEFYIQKITQHLRDNEAEVTFKEV